MYYVNIMLGLLFAWFLVRGVFMSLGRSKRLAPGPFPLPIIGNLHLLGDIPHISLTQLAKHHCAIMNLKLGQINTVVISSSVMAKEILQKQDLSFSSRFIPDALHACDPLILLLYGHNLDVSKHLRSEKVQELIDYCHNSTQNCEAVDIGRAAFRTSLNLLSNTIFSKDLTDPFSHSAKEFKDLVRNITIEADKPNLVDYFPFLQRIDPQGIRQRMTNHFTKVLQLMSGLIDERLKERKLGKHTNVDVLDSLLNISLEETDRNHIRRTDTTSNTLEWAMAELLKNPHTLEKAQEELAQVIGRGKIIDEADVAKLPYLRCIVKETFRIRPQAPFLVPHKAVEGVDICGYIIPKDTQVLVNNLPGLPLAIRMIPVALGSLLNTFNWKLPSGIAPKDLDMEEKFGITLAKA
ncbi:Geraniol 8-hydroxylase [Capsicum chinense]|nr:Geraniol 8-hydroxylase [Capsicum chinense]